MCGAINDCFKLDIFLSFLVVNVFLLRFIVLSVIIMSLTVLSTIVPFVSHVSISKIMKSHKMFD
jgi:hypothetical protein